MITPAVGDDAVAAREGFHLRAKNMQVSKSAMNKHERFSLTAFEVVERGLLISIAWISEPQDSSELVRPWAMRRARASGERQHQD